MAIEYRVAYGTPELLEQGETWGKLGAIRYLYVSYRGFSVPRSIPVDNLGDAKVQLDQLRSLTSAVDVKFVPRPQLESDDAQPSKPATPNQP